MTGLETGVVPATTRRPARAVVVLGAVATAVAVNLIVYGAGRLAGGDFEFTRDGQVAQVDAITVAGFSALPLGIGLGLVAVLARVRWVVLMAGILAPALAVLTIGVMTLPVDLDPTSTIALAGCHLTLVPISVLAIRRLAH